MEAGLPEAVRVHLLSSGPLPAGPSALRLPAVAPKPVPWASATNVSVGTSGQGWSLNCPAFLPLLMVSTRHLQFQFKAVEATCL